MIRAGLWLALHLLVLISPSFAIHERWSRLDDARQPAVQSAPAVAATAARPTGDDGDLVAIELRDRFLGADDCAAVFEIAQYGSTHIIEVASFDARAPPQG